MLERCGISKNEWKIGCVPSSSTQRPSGNTRLICRSKLPHVAVAAEVVDDQEAALLQVRAQVLDVLRRVIVPVAGLGTDRSTGILNSSGSLNDMMLLSSMCVGTLVIAVQDLQEVLLAARVVVRPRRALPRRTTGSSCGRTGTCRRTAGCRCRTASGSRRAGPAPSRSRTITRTATTSRDRTSICASWRRRSRPLRQPSRSADTTTPRPSASAAAAA